jgi:hypothetical protein
MNISISRLLLIAAVMVAVLTVAIVGYLQWSRPLHLRVAVGPRDGVDARLLAAFDHLLDTSRAGVRLDLVATAGVRQTICCSRSGTSIWRSCGSTIHCPRARLLLHCCGPTS